MSWLRAIPFLFTLLAFVLQPASASAFGPAHPEARVSAFELVALASVGASAETSPGLHKGIAEAYDEAASGYRFAARGAGRAKNKLRPDTSAEGAHSTFKRGADGKTSNYATYEPNPKNPSGFQETKRVDVTGRPHRNPDGTVVPTPHVKEAGVKGVRPARPEELP